MSMEEPSERPATEAAQPAENLISTRSLVSYFREIVPLILGGSEGELTKLLSLDDSEKSLARYACMG